MPGVRHEKLVIVPEGRYFRFKYTGGGMLPVSLQGKYVSIKDAQVTLDMFRRKTYPELYAG